MNVDFIQLATSLMTPVLLLFAITGGMIYLRLYLKRQEDMNRHNIYIAEKEIRLREDERDIRLRDQARLRDAQEQEAATATRSEPYGGFSFIEIDDQYKPIFSDAMQGFWPLEKAIETSVEATAFAHKNGLEVVFFPIDFSRAELKWAIDLIEKVGKEGHMDPPSLKLRRGKPAFAKASAGQARLR